jgi:hypothetical protein
VKLDGYCRCKRLRSECEARCEVCGADANWQTKTQTYRCEKHEEQR